MTLLSTPITECLKDCTASERKAIEVREPPYDGVRTWGDLLVIRAAKKDKPGSTEADGA